MKPKLTILILSILLHSVIFAQHLPVSQSKLNAKFGEIHPEDFNPQSPVIDSGSNAVVLLDVGSTDIDGNNNGFFTLVFKVHERILLKSRNAFDAATEKVFLFNGSATTSDKFDDFEASTFNLENGHITETKMDKNSLFKEKYNKDYIYLKFTLPNLKEGSIIEYQYTIKSPFASNDMRTWSFQGEYPSLWSEYKVTIPPFYNYAIVGQGYLPYAIDTGGKMFKNYTIIRPGDAASSSEVIRISGDAKWGWWAMKDIPAFKSDSYISSSKNYISQIKFQLQSIHYSDDHIVQIVKDWYSTVDDLMQNENFGKSLTEPNSWFRDDLKRACGSSAGLEKAKKIYEFVRDNFTCTDDDEIYLSQPLKKTYQTRKGNVADINLLLTAMLVDQGFDAHPVILSTRENGWVDETSAFLYQYNYVISRVQIDSVYYLLDASINRLGFGKLSTACYNRSGRLIDKTPYLIPLSTDSLSETKNTLLFVSNDEKGGMNGSFTSNLGYFESMDLREKLAKSKLEDVIKDIAKGYPAEMELSNITIDSAKNYDEPITIKHDFKLKFDEDIVYFNPMFSEAQKTNLFTAENRLYPVEMPYKMNEVYILNMEIPKGYIVDELPKSARIKLNENEGMFEYLLVKNGDALQFRTRLVINKANFNPEDYQTLRDFFSYVVKKEAEQIVFKKAK